MPICIECCFPVSHLYTTYSKADDRALGKGVRLTQCPRCKQFADKYVEHDFVVLFIDLVLIKPQVYRHLLFNRLGREDDKFDRSIIRLGILILLFDVYLSWARIEKSTSLSSSSLANTPILVQYIFFLTLNTLATLAHHSVVRLLAYALIRNPRPAPWVAATATGGGAAAAAAVDGSAAVKRDINACSNDVSSPNTSPTISSPPSQHAVSVNPPPPPSSPPALPASDEFWRRASATAPLRIRPVPPPTPASVNFISIALIVSSCTKLFPILLVIWNPETLGSKDSPKPSSTSAIATFTEIAVSMVTALPVSTTAAIAAAATTTITAVRATPESMDFSPAIVPVRESKPFPTPRLSALSSSVLDPLLSVMLSVTNTYLVWLNNIEALYILLDCGYLRAMMMAMGGQAARWIVERTLLHAIGL